MKAGDKFRPKPKANYGAGEGTIKWVGDRVLVYTQQISGEPFEQAMSIAAFKQNFEIIEPFFEAGKTYTCAGDEFTVEYIENDAEGDVAIGKVTAPNGRFVWRIKRKDSFPLWQEVE